MTFHIGFQFLQTADLQFQLDSELQSKSKLESENNRLKQDLRDVQSSERELLRSNKKLRVANQSPKVSCS